MNIRVADVSRHLNELMRLAGQWLNPLWDKETKEKWLVEVLSSFGEHIIYVAEDGKKLTGFVDFLFWYDWLTKKKCLLIQHVYVDEDYRHQGIGTKMLEAINERYKPNFSIVDTKPKKFPHAEKLYLKVGFKVNPDRKWLERYGN